MADNDEKFYYRYEEGKFEPGDTIPARDYIGSMKGAQLANEQFFREYPEKGALRGSGVFVYDDAAHTRRQWTLQGGVKGRERYLYKVRVKKVIIGGDVTLYNECQPPPTISEDEKIERRKKYFEGGVSSNPQMEYVAEGVVVEKVLGTPAEAARAKKDALDAKMRARFAGDNFYLDPKIKD